MVLLRDGKNGANVLSNLVFFFFTQQICFFFFTQQICFFSLHNKSVFFFFKNNPISFTCAKRVLSYHLKIIGCTNKVNTDHGCAIWLVQYEFIKCYAKFWDKRLKRLHLETKKYLNFTCCESGFDKNIGNWSSNLVKPLRRRISNTMLIFEIKISKDCIWRKK